MHELPKGSWLVLGVILVCGLLVGGISYWLGDGMTSSTAATDITDEKEVTLDESLPAPLSPDELAAYQVDVINEMNPIATITTNQGIIELELFEDTMPITAGNFIKLAEEGFYNGTKFHRVIDQFMIQGGDPISKTEEVFKYGTGGPGYTIPDEHVKGEYLTNVRGTIAMANSGPNSGGSQFFINLVDNERLDFDVEDPNNSKHPVFGRVVRGMDVVDKIGKVEVNTGSSVPLTPIVVESVKITKGS